ncbi:hypothetical protein LY90DRAFT_222664 [Neocallimastix californiae]|uniref:Uncharacterized protein n=1 Tax=Neocallimastix californiae TaxID=1754190 RepID=A0A1Y2E5L0_9FUNG|nr:hypothetical protein LY90DRAFT_222664 [Neocallimastix californiae]|eukprot:ORY66737.1 hypothetical protein LY90DRAFT_222664 [Neocallimastix californiae]
MINALQEKLNLEKNTSSNVENNNNESVEIKNLTRQKSLIDKNVPPKPLDENTLNNDNIKSIDNNMKKSSYKHKIHQLQYHYIPIIMMIVLKEIMKTQKAFVKISKL